MDLLSSTLNGIGQVGEGIDKFTGGRALRGAVAGKPRELLSVLPFSDTLGLTDHHDMTTGRDITDKYGLTNKHDNGWGAWGAGFLADNVLSPVNMLGAGAAFKAAPTLAKGITSGAKALTGLDLLDHVAGGARKLGGFVAGDAGSLHLPYDHLAEPPPGMPRSDPEWVNNRTFHHGTSVPDLTGESIDPMKTDPGGLFGRGIYTTDSRTISSEYADARMGQALGRYAGSLFSPGNTRRLVKSGQLDPELIRRFLGNEARDEGPEDLLHAAEHYVGHLASDVAGGHRSLTDADVKPLADLYSSRFNPGGPPAHTIYQAQSDYGKILDLDQPATHHFADTMQSVLTRRADELGASDRDRPELLAMLGRLQSARSEGRIGSIASGQALQKALGLDTFLGDTDATRAIDAGLKAGGYDALTHTGGLQSGGNRLHQVVIGLDPNDKFGLGRATPYKLWEAIKNFGGNESGSLNLGAFGNRRASIDDTLSNASMRGAVKRAADQFTRGYGALPHHEANDLATRFFRLPEGVSAEDAAAFTAKVEAGRKAAQDYFSPLYYHVNKHLRDLGPEAAPAEIAAIRSGKYGDLAHATSNPDQGEFGGMDQLFQIGGDGEFHPTEMADHLANQVNGGHAPVADDDWIFGDAPVPQTGTSSHPNQLIDPVSGLPAPPHPGSGDPFAGDDFEAMAAGKEMEDSLFSDTPAPTQVGAPFPADPAKIAEFEKLAGIPASSMYPVDFANTNDFGGFQAAGKQAFGDQYNDYLKHLGLSTPEPYYHQAAAAAPVQPPVPPDKVAQVRPVIAGLMGLLDHSALPQDMHLHRGIDGKGQRLVESILGAPLNSPEAVGKEFVDPGFLSTAFDPADARRFAGLDTGYNRPDPGVTFDFGDVPKGKQASFMNATENEILFPPGRRIRITDNANYPHLKATLWGTLLAAMMGGNAAQHSYQER